MKNPLPRHADWRSVLQYAVAVPLMPADEGWQLVLELRNPHLRSHPNEVSFPGGRIEAYDAHPGVTALREMAEEIGTPSESWELLGALPLAYGAVAVADGTRTRARRNAGRRAPGRKLSL